MTEEEWLVPDDPNKMSRFLDQSTRLLYSKKDKDYSIRKLRLFSIARCKLLWRILRKSQRDAIDIIEQYVEKEISISEFISKIKEVEKNFELYGLDSPLFTMEIESATSKTWNEMKSQQLKKQVEMLRCMIPNPYKPVVRDDYAKIFIRVDGKTPYSDCRYPIMIGRYDTLLTENILSVAKKIYDEKRYEDMPILGDALEDAGCTDNEMLLHCRDKTCDECNGEGMIDIDNGGNVGKGHCIVCHDTGKAQRIHFRGCWVTDLLLGKE